MAGTDAISPARGTYTPSTTPTFSPHPTPKPEREAPSLAPIGTGLAAGAAVGGVARLKVAGKPSGVAPAALAGGKRGAVLIAAGLLAGAAVGGGVAWYTRGRQEARTHALGKESETATPIARKPLSKARPNNAYTPHRNDLLPDVSPWAPKEIFVEEDGKTRNLRFSATFPNFGNGPLEISFDNDGLGNVRQRIYNRDGTRREVRSNASMKFDKREDHGHNHLNDFARYELFEAKQDGTAGKRVRVNHKVSFMITDTDRIAPGLDPDGKYRADRRSPNGARAVQGLSVGYGDTYGSGLSGQGFDIGDLPPGQYILRQTFDPSDRLAEANENNNQMDTLITLERDQGKEVKAEILGPPRVKSPEGAVIVGGRGREGEDKD